MWPPRCIERPLIVYTMLRSFKVEFNCAERCHRHIFWTSGSRVNTAIEIAIALFVMLAVFAGLRGNWGRRAYRYGWRPGPYCVGGLKQRGPGLAPSGLLIRLGRSVGPAAGPPIRRPSLLGPDIKRRSGLAGALFSEEQKV